MAMHIFHIKKRFEDVEDEISEVGEDVAIEDIADEEEDDVTDMDESTGIEDYFNFSIEKLKDADGEDLTSKIDTELIFEDDDDLIDYLSEVFDYDPDEVDIKEEV